MPPVVYKSRKKTAVHKLVNLHQGRCHRRRTHRCVVLYHLPCADVVVGHGIDPGDAAIFHEAALVVDAVEPNCAEAAIDFAVAAQLGEARAVGVERIHCVGMHCLPLSICVGIQHMAL